MNRRLTAAYVFAAFLALAAAFYTALDFAPPRAVFDHGQVIARVNDTDIPMAEYVRATDAMQAGLERPLTQEDRTRALSVLINEELIVQEALRLNLASDDRLIRKNLVQALINSVILLDTTPVASENTLRTFYQNEKELFMQPLHVTVNAARATGQKKNAGAFAQALRNGLTFAQAGASTGYEPVKLPAALPIATLGAILGGPARDAVLTMSEGDIAGPVESGGDELFVWLLKRDGGEQNFEQVKDRVAAEWQRRQEELALDHYLNRLRQRARIKHYLHEDQ